jgi:hypothetical protein
VEVVIDETLLPTAVLKSGARYQSQLTGAESVAVPPEFPQVLPVLVMALIVGADPETSEGVVAVRLAATHESSISYLPVIVLPLQLKNTKAVER